MFNSFRSLGRVDKASARQKKSKAIRNDAKKRSKLQRSVEEDHLLPKRALTSPIVTLKVGEEGRLFAAHEDVLCQAPFFERVFQDPYPDAQNKRISMPDEEPEIFSAVLEYLYKGDYYPRLLRGKRRDSWKLEDLHTAAGRCPAPENGRGRGAVEATVHISGVDDALLRETVIYCAAERFGLAELKRLALRKQGLQSGIGVATVLRSARYAYDNTPDTDSRLRAHYLALIVRCRKTFKTSGTMQMEMERGGEIFFDLFVAMCNHLDDVAAATTNTRRHWII